VVPPMFAMSSAPQARAAVKSLLLITLIFCRFRMCRLLHGALASRAGVPTPTVVGRNHSLNFGRFRPALFRIYTKHVLIDSAGLLLLDYLCCYRLCIVYGTRGYWSEHKSLKKITRTSLLQFYFGLQKACASMSVAGRHRVARPTPPFAQRVAYRHSAKRTQSHLCGARSAAVGRE
jgi:hypothetical protein